MADPIPRLTRPTRTTTSVPPSHQKLSPTKPQPPVPQKDGNDGLESPPPELKGTENPPQPKGTDKPPTPKENPAPAAPPIEEPHDVQDELEKWKISEIIDIDDLYGIDILSTPVFKQKYRIVQQCWEVPQYSNPKLTKRYFEDMVKQHQKNFNVIGLEKAGKSFFRNPSIHYDLLPTGDKRYTMVVTYAYPSLEGTIYAMREDLGEGYIINDVIPDLKNSFE